MGQFVSVKLFMKGLVGPDPIIKMERQTTEDTRAKASFKKWQSKWDGWQLGFCHFVQLFSEPTEDMLWNQRRICCDMLWVLLGRRAAGVLPRNQSGADLVIPIFHREKREVSLILAQVKAGTAMMHPANVFAWGNSLSEKLPCDVIGICMSQQEMEDQYARYEKVDVSSVEESEGLASSGPNVSKECSASTTPAPQAVSSRQNKQRKQHRNQSPTNFAATETVDAFTLCFRSLQPWMLSEKNTGDATRLLAIPEAAALVNNWQRWLHLFGIPLLLYAVIWTIERKLK
ncbi:hypothetical protein GQ600_24397 [Phytophthora cactorum]|nr:hypothetical protein GQ600_24397 [Phytophthora cactorum]